MTEQNRNGSKVGSKGTAPEATKRAEDPGTTGTGSSGSAAGGVSGQVGERGTTKGEMPTAEMTSRPLEDDAGENFGTVGEMIADGDTAATTRAGADDWESASDAG